MSYETTSLCHCDPKFVGLDLSFNSSGLVILDLNHDILEKQVITTDKQKTIEERIIQIEDSISFVPNIVGLHSVYIEGLSFSSGGNVGLQMAALNYHIRIFFFKKRINYKIIPPTTLKKFVCGNGLAKKDLILLNVYKKWQVSFDDHNLADAYCLCRMAVEDFKHEHKTE